MSELIILDVSAIVHTGQSTAMQQADTYYGCPVKGIHYLNSYVCNTLCRYRDIVFAFDSPSFRNELFEDYKSGRVKNYEVISQIELAYDQLSACGFRCEKYDEYEADDIIDWAVQEWQGSQEYSEIIIVGNDMDLCHSVQPLVQFESCSTNVNSVTWQSFTSSVEKNKEIKFNTISAYKVFCGCHSDKIPAFKTEAGVRGSNLYKEFVGMLDYLGVCDYKRTSSIASLRYFVEKSGYFSDKDKAEIEQRIKLVFPAEKPESVHIVPNKCYGYDRDKLIHYFSLFNDRNSLKCFDSSGCGLSQKDKEFLAERSKMLSTGMYAVDHDIPADVGKSLNEVVLGLDAFSEDF